MNYLWCLLCLVHGFSETAHHLYISPNGANSNPGTKELPKRDIIFTTPNSESNQILVGVFPGHYELEEYRLDNSQRLFLDGISTSFLRPKDPDHAIFVLNDADLDAPNSHIQLTTNSRVLVEVNGDYISTVHNLTVSQSFDSYRVNGAAFLVNHGELQLHHISASEIHFRPDILRPHGVVLVNHRAKSLIVSNSVFKDITKPSGFGAAISTTIPNPNAESKCNLFRIGDRCLFENCKSSRGGAVLLMSSTVDCQFEIEDAYFKNNEAETLGGALYVYGRGLSSSTATSQVKMTHVLFHENEAKGTDLEVRKTTVGHDLFVYFKDEPSVSESEFHSTATTLDSLYSFVHKIGSGSRKDETAIDLEMHHSEAAGVVTEFIYVTPEAKGGIPYSSATSCATPVTPCSLLGEGLKKFNTFTVNPKATIFLRPDTFNETGSILLSSSRDKVSIIGVAEYSIVVLPKGATFDVQTPTTILRAFTINFDLVSNAMKVGSSVELTATQLTMQGQSTTPSIVDSKPIVLINGKGTFTECTFKNIFAKETSVLIDPSAALTFKECLFEDVRTLPTTTIVIDETVISFNPSIKLQSGYTITFQDTTFSCPTNQTGQFKFQADLTTNVVFEASTNTRNSFSKIYSSDSCACVIDLNKHDSLLKVDFEDISGATGHPSLQIISPSSVNTITLDQCSFTRIHGNDETALKLDGSDPTADLSLTLTHCSFTECEVTGPKGNIFSSANKVWYAIDTLDFVSCKAKDATFFTFAPVAKADPKVHSISKMTFTHCAFTCTATPIPGLIFNYPADLPLSSLSFISCSTVGTSLLRFKPTTEGQITWSEIVVQNGIYNCVPARAVDREKRQYQQGYGAIVVEAIDEVHLIQGSNFTDVISVGMPFFVAKRQDISERTFMLTMNNDRFVNCKTQHADGFFVVDTWNNPVSFSSVSVTSCSSSGKGIITIRHIVPTEQQERIDEQIAEGEPPEVPVYDNKNTLFQGQITVNTQQSPQGSIGSGFAVVGNTDVNYTETFCPITGSNVVFTSCGSLGSGGSACIFDSVKSTLSSLSIRVSDGLYSQIATNNSVIRMTQLSLANTNRNALSTIKGQAKTEDEINKLVEVASQYGFIFLNRSTTTIADSIFSVSHIAGIIMRGGTLTLEACTFDDVSIFPERYPDFRMNVKCNESGIISADVNTNFLSGSLTPIPAEETKLPSWVLDAFCTLSIERKTVTSSDTTLATYRRPHYPSALVTAATGFVDSTANQDIPKLYLVVEGTELMPANFTCRVRSKTKGTKESEDTYPIPYNHTHVRCDLSEELAATGDLFAVQISNDGKSFSTPAVEVQFELNHTTPVEPEKPVPPVDPIGPGAKAVDSVWPVVVIIVVVVVAVIAAGMIVLVIFQKRNSNKDKYQQLREDSKHAEPLDSLKWNDPNQINAIFNAQLDMSFMKENFEKEDEEEKIAPDAREKRHEITSESIESRTYQDPIFWAGNKNRK
ncbi:hypothetical protein BLNAU_16837 [Blattamonas nauphoetae]|uniref:Uncharacterized protein n=1 Tax=Blattamonas nauphoetae TaxID=2049346 RepID=A0ABQ9X7Z2_9EUKA|nr:hypothetical protein BLNAU_16837 [Blattamonas nauphoetae]